jgi:hypothetical protein
MQSTLNYKVTAFISARQLYSVPERGQILPNPSPQKPYIPHRQILQKNPPGAKFYPPPPNSTKNPPAVHPQIVSRMKIKT